MENLKLVEFKCPKCGKEWSITVSSKAAVSARQRCPECRKYSDDCLKPFNPWAAAAKAAKEAK
jgi:predicted RNA-binding Zn-ribbon protein involved in translation (DUF1610 family)